MNLVKIGKNYPIFYKTATYLQKNAFFFRRSIPELISPDYNFERAERICSIALRLSSNDWNNYFKNVHILIDLSLDFLKLQIQLEKTGKYLFSTFKEVEKEVYSNDGGPNYLWGLYFSEIFWKTHHNLVNFYFDNFVTKNQSKGTILEVPVGTGFFLTEFLNKNPQWEGMGIDLSNTAVSFSRMILKENNIPEKSYQIIKENFLNYQTTRKFDKIICGEFLEHVENPILVLKKLKSLINERSKIFLTVAVWAGGIDHINLYTKPSEVREQINKSDLRIENELVQSVFEKDSGNVEKGKIPVNYAAILSKN